MTPHHHPSEERLLEHAAGALPEGRDLVVAAHVAVCPACRAEVRHAEAVGGALLESLPPEPMAADALAHALALVERPAPPQAPPAMRPDWIPFPSPALETAWRHRRWAAPGVWVAPVIRGPGKARTYLLRVGAGMSVPRHRHEGAELVTVLKGAFDDRGDAHRPGDFSENDESVEHRPTVTRDGECVCLICADAPLIPLDWVGRLFQPFVRI
jgi:putative transcriptional regulator